MIGLRESFDVFTAAPSGVKKLRELILQLAVQGKLVPQDPNDEPASVLLKKIAAEKAKLLAEGKIKKSKPLPPIDPDEVPFDVPEGWEWTRLGSLGEFLGGGTPSKSRSDFWDGEVPWVSPKDMKKDWIDGSIDTITEEAVSHSSVKLIPPRAVLFVVRGMILVHTFPVAITARTVTINQDMKALVLHRSEHAEYVAFVAKSLSGWILSRVQISSHGTRRLESEELSGFPIAVPPVAEQTRILAKVDQLMALCDELEAKCTTQREQRQALNAAALDALLAARDQAEFDAAWRRVRDIFDLLYDAPESVARLRQAILQLAVQGKLVPQDPNDEPASVLLEKITAEKAKLLAEGKIKKSKPLPPIDPDDVPFDVPEGWEWVKLAVVVIDGPTNGYSPKPVEGPTRVRTLALGATTYGEFDDSQFKYVDEEIPEDSNLWLKDGDILVQRGNTIDYVGIAAVYRGALNRFIYPDLMMRLRAATLVCEDYLHGAMNAATARSYFREHATGTSGTMPKINQDTVRNLPIPLPPLAEQKRILSRRRQLMSLCDKLESKLTGTRERAEGLVSAVVGQFQGKGATA